MTKDQALDEIYALQDAVALVSLDSDIQTAQMQILVGCAQLISKIDKI